MNLQVAIHKGNCIICKSLFYGNELKKMSNIGEMYFNKCKDCMEKPTQPKHFDNTNFKTEYIISCKECKYSSFLLIYGFRNISNMDLLTFTCKCKATEVK